MAESLIRLDGDIIQQKCYVDHLLSRLVRNIKDGKAKDYVLHQICGEGTDYVDFLDEHKAYTDIVEQRMRQQKAIYELLTEFGMEKGYI